MKLEVIIILVINILCCKSELVVQKEFYARSSCLGNKSKDEKQIFGPADFTNNIVKCVDGYKLKLQDEGETEVQSGGCIQLKNAIYKSVKITWSRNVCNTMPEHYYKQETYSNTNCSGNSSDISIFDQKVSCSTESQDSIRGEFRFKGSNAIKTISNGDCVKINVGYGMSMSVKTIWPRKCDNVTQQDYYVKQHYYKEKTYPNTNCAGTPIDISIFDYKLSCSTESKDSIRTEIKFKNSGVKTISSGDCVKIDLAKSVKRMWPGQCAVEDAADSYFCMCIDMPSCSPYNFNDVFTTSLKPH
jgi:hypothetical protein